MDTREGWDLLNQRIKEENESMIPNLFQIHMGAFEDLRKSGHMLSVNGQPVNVLAPTMTPDERFSLACQIGRSQIEAHTGIVNGDPGTIFVIRKADFFPNCIAIAIGAVLESLRTSHPDNSRKVLCNYETIEGSGDPFGQTLSILAACLPQAAFLLNDTKIEAPQPAETPTLPLNEMNTLFQAEAIAKIDTALTGFAGRVVRGEIREGDVLNVTDGTGRQICPPGVVRAIFLKDRVENGKPVGEQSKVLGKDQHADSLLVAVEVPKGSYDSILLSKKDGGTGFFSKLFGKRKA